MMDFSRWREWLKSETERLTRDGLAAEWSYRDERLRLTSVSLKGFGLLGQFRCYENGLVDFEVFDLDGGTFIASEAMVAVTDASFPGEFAKFVGIIADRRPRPASGGC